MPVYNMIYLGKFADIDPDERSSSSEMATRYFAGRSFGDRDHPLFGKLTEVTMHDTNRDGLLQTNNWSGTQEKISYSLDGGPVSSYEIDGAFSASRVAVTRLLPDGRTDTVLTTVRVFQDTSGQTFLLPPPLTSATASEVAAMTSHPIIGITLPAASSFRTEYNSAYAGRYDMASFVPCFVAGTLIRTDRGEAPVETLTAGDLVATRDHGMQTIRWIGRRTLSPAELAADPRLAPIRLAAGSLGQGLPARDLRVSPQHRILVRSRIAVRMFGAAEVLVAAKALAGLPGIAPEPASDQPVTYVHLMFDRHEVIFSDGAETESLYVGPMALPALGSEALEEIYRLFPDLRDAETPPPGARQFATMRRARQLAGRHSKAGLPLWCDPCEAGRDGRSAL